MEKMIFSRKKSTFLLGGWDGRRFGGEVDKLRGGGEGETPLHFLVDSFGGGDGKGGILGLLHRWEKVRNFAGHSARKVRSTQNDTREHIRTGHIRIRQNAQ